MDLNEQYWLVGGDGSEYGPHSLATLQQWVLEGRVAPESRVRSAQDAPWRPASTIEGLRWHGSAPPPGGNDSLRAEPVAPDPVPGRIQAAVRSYGNWFYWIAGLSLVNIVMLFWGSGFGFAVSTTVTDLIGAIAAGLNSGGRAVALVLDAMVLAGLCLLGWLAGRGSVWAFAIGLVLYGLDGILAAWFRQWISAAFHGYVVWQLYKGWQLARWMRRGAG